MAQFEEAFKIGIVNEGGWCNTAGDRGGETYEGIARKDWPNWIGWKKIDAWKSTHGTPPNYKTFSEIEISGLNQDVMDFYKPNFWDKMHGDDIISQKVADYFYDWFINSMGVATKHLQQILGITVDGGFGSVTLQAVNVAGEDLLDNLHTSRDQFYASHVEAVPQDAKFLDGWNKRSDNLYQNLSNAA